MPTIKSITSINRIYKFLSVEDVPCEVRNIFYTQFRSVSVLKELIFFPYSKFYSSKPHIAVIPHYTLVRVKCCSFCSTCVHGTVLVRLYCRFYGRENSPSNSFSERLSTDYQQNKHLPNSEKIKKEGIM